MILSEAQSQILRAMPEHSRRVVSNRLEQGDEERGARWSGKEPVGDGAFCKIVEQVFQYSAAVDHEQMLRLRAIWDDSDNRQEGELIWCLMSAEKVALSRIVFLVEKWRREYKSALHWVEMREAIKHGANLRTMRELFFCDDADFHRLKDEGGRCHYRTKVLSEPEDVELFRLWNSEGKPDGLQGLLSISRKTGYALSLLHPMIQEWSNTEKLVCNKQQQREG